jgi:hypothetical protein
MHDAQWMLLAPLIGCVLGVLCLWAALAAARKGRLVHDLPVSKTTGVFIGLVDVQGTAESEQPLVSYLTERACVYYQWSIEEQWSRMMVETYTDGEGKTQTRMRQETGWAPVGQGGEAQNFYLKDDCGIVRVVPEGAKVEPVKLFEHLCGQLDPIYYGKGPAMAVADSTGHRRFVETAIPLHAPLYVMGQARERQDVIAPEIAADKSAPMFLISTRTREQISSGFGWAEWGWGLAGLALFAAGPIAGSALAHRTVGPVPSILLGVVYLAFAAAGWIWMAYNSLIDLRQRTRQAWSQVDVQLKRRYDLIPNLVKTIQGYTTHEKDLQTELARLRAEMNATAPGAAGPDFRACAASLIAVAEQYPDLKAQPSFLSLQKTLSETEQRIALARGYFNDIATYYNTRLEIVPDRFLAMIGAMKPVTLMAANDFERAPVEVSLANGGEGSAVKEAPAVPPPAQT